MAWYPKAIRKPITRHDTPRRGVGAICNHVAVSEGTSLFGYFNQPGNATSHFYVRKTGKVEQYVDTRFQAPANYEGNDRLISIETQGGVRNADSEPWTDAQVQALAELHAWISKTDGIPLVLMKDSKPTTAGVGYHKLGVDPYRVSGGEKWSKAYGKICPGAGKIRQIPQIIAKAKALVGTPVDTEEQEVAGAVQELKDFIEARTQAYAAHNDKHLDQMLAKAQVAIDALIEEAKKAILEYTRVATISIKDYVRQIDDEAEILAAVVSVKADVAAVAADVDKLEAEAEEEAPKA